MELNVCLLTCLSFMYVRALQCCEYSIQGNSMSENLAQFSKFEVFSLICNLIEEIFIKTYVKFKNLSSVSHAQLKECFFVKLFKF